MFVFALVSKPDGRRRGGRLIASLVLLSLLVTLNFVLVRQRLDQELETATEAATREVAATVELGLSHVAELVFSLASYFEASDEVTPDEFEYFVTPPLQRIGEVKSLMWIELDSTASEERAWLRYAHPESPERLHEGDLLRDPEVGPLLMARDRSRVEVGQLSSERGRGSFVAVVWSNRGRSSGWAAAELSLHEFLLHVFQGEIPDGLELRTSKMGDHAPNPRAARIYFGNHPVDVMLQGTPLGAQNRHRNALLLAYVVGTLFAAAVVLFLLVVTAHNAELGAEVASRHEAERRLASLADQLERSNRDLEAFASGVSHDLRAPLRAITGLTGVVLQEEGARLTEDARHMLSLVRKRADRLDNMIRGLLAYARARANDDPETVDLRALVSEAIDVAVVPSAFVLHVQVPRSARVRRVALLAVLSNLIANAVRHHDRSSGNIGVSARRVGDRLKWIVEDDGPGVPESDREKIFGVFTTLRARDEVESTGMGLATVRRLVSGEGGEIYCESGDFHGVRMRFSWPTPPEDQENG
jgi:signal transduction histidine kinase